MIGLIMLGLLGLGPVLLLGLDLQLPSDRRTRRIILRDHALLVREKIRISRLRRLLGLLRRRIAHLLGRQRSVAMNSSRRERGVNRLLLSAFVVVLLLGQDFICA